MGLVTAAVARGAPGRGGVAGDAGRDLSAALLTAAFAACLLLVGRRHEPWFDEAQAWLLARDSTLWELLAERVRYEGSPGLWHALLWTVQQLGLPYEQITLVPAALASAGAFLVLRHAPFPAAIRIGIVLSYVFAYQYAIVARSYALDLVLVPLLALSFARRLDHPVRHGLLIGGLANGNAHGFVVAAVLGAEFAWTSLRERRVLTRANVVGVATAAILGALAAAQAWPPADGTFLQAAYPVVDLSMLVVRFSQAFIERGDLAGWTPPGSDAVAWGFRLSLLVLAPSLVLFLRAGRLGLYLALTGALLAFSVAAYGNAWHTGFLFLAWLFCLWTSWGEVARAGPPLRAALGAGVGSLLAASAASTAAAWSRDWHDPYSSSPAVARWLSGQAPGPVAGLGFKLFAIQPYFPANVFANQRGGAAKPAFIEWRRGATFPISASLDVLAGLLAGSPAIVLVSTYALDPDEDAATVALARRAGYCEAARFAGGLIWKGYSNERDDTLALTRCPDR